MITQKKSHLEIIFPCIFIQFLLLLNRTGKAIWLLQYKRYNSL